MRYSFVLSFLVAALTWGAATADSGSYLQIRAVLHPEGLSIHRKHPLRWVKRKQPQSIHRSSGELCLRIEYADGNHDQHVFDAFIEGDSADSPKYYGGFTLELAVRPDTEIHLIKLKRTDSGKELTRWENGEVPRK